MRLGAEVVAADRYADAPAMHVAHRGHVLAMTDGVALRALVESEQPHVIVPEIEQIDTRELVRLESDGWVSILGAEATRATMDRERIRRLATETAKVTTSRYAFADTLSEARDAMQSVGVPCVVKAMTSSSGHGMTVVREAGSVESAYREASAGGRVPSPRVMIEEFLHFELEVTVLTLRHYDPDRQVTTSFCAPVAHKRPGTLYHESWQPADLSEPVVR